MSIIVGVDIGNSTTEAAIARIREDGSPEFLSSGTTMTTGIKGTVENIPGVVEVLEEATEAAGIGISDLDLVLLNEATPVIGDVAMETVTETIVTESSMVGHNPSSPGGKGIGVGRTVHIRDLEDGKAEAPDEPVIVVVPQEYDFEVAAGIIGRALEAGVEVRAGIVQGNDGVLISNRLPSPLPFVDEVAHVDKVPLNMLAAVEVAPQGQGVRQLSNPYGIATLFSLSPEETGHVIPISKALVGLRSAVVIRTPAGDVQSKQIPAGSIRFIGENQSLTVELEHGADAIMETLARAQPLSDVRGESGTNVGGMIENVRQTMADVTEKPLSEVNIHDVLAVDCLVPQQVVGGVADEFSIESATGLAIMVDTDRLLMERVADTLSEKIGVQVELGGVEANTAIMGALTTPGIDVPVAIIDGGAGSTDGAELQKGKPVEHVHLAGAGNMVTLLIKNELGLDRFDVAEQIKIHPLAKVESLFHIRHEDNGVQFFEDPLEANLFARVVLVTDNGLVPIDTKHTLDRIRTVRQEAKRKVLLRNSLRVLRHISPSGNIRFLNFVAIVGRLGLDFELPQMLMNELSNFGIVVGVANVRGELGPTNAVATGLIINYCQRQDTSE
ncbi:MAG: Propanediol dehydratase reactivation factor large subunit [uncultured Rubrobacteraceae bacterium]|uniref:Propanediol dehydratase reactivation factor large subunit n=1 Tax=uncultured Rubrobacteraceae bacterium TaxID=349277 RepID=A0A6J4RXB6_9ACTN|nr:MAG: Propanediol dehydratase reactivation factor large subunit [uncultured Rubrobacteraceae bacterium]